MQIDINTKTIGELALELPNAISVMERWQIDYCCHGKRSIADACRAAGITAGELLTALGQRRDPVASDWLTAPLSELQAYIIETHHLYTRDAIETIALLADKVARRHGPGHPEVLEVQQLVGALANDLIPHMMKEERILFPYVEGLENGGAEGSCFGTIANPLRQMMMEHESVGDLLIKLRRATAHYRLPDDACLSFRALYERLEDLERDLHQHIHLENNIHFPRALELERAG
jgi:regulator of cell morphogenesis and NO signaling